MTPRRSAIWTTTELAKRVSELRRDLLGLRFANATGELEDTASLRRARSATWHGR